MTNECGIYKQDLTKRIEATSVTGRSVPETNDVSILATELKLRLAATSDIVMENGRRGSMTKVTAISRGQRMVPLWEIDNNQEPTLLCQVKVKVSPLNKKRRKFK